jgi:hypothetical protein
MQVGKVEKEVGGTQVYIVVWPQQKAGAAHSDLASFFFRLRHHSWVKSEGASGWRAFLF